MDHSQRTKTEIILVVQHAVALTVVVCTNKATESPFILVPTQSKILIDVS
jgi:hypothetical protein